MSASSSSADLNISYDDLVEEEGYIFGEELANHDAAWLQDEELYVTPEALNDANKAQKEAERDNLKTEAQKPYRPATLFLVSLPLTLVSISALLENNSGTNASLAITSTSLAAFSGYKMTIDGIRYTIELFQGDRTEKEAKNDYLKENSEISVSDTEVSVRSIRELAEYEDHLRSEL